MDSNQILEAKLKLLSMGELSDEEARVLYSQLQQTDRQGSSIDSSSLEESSSRYSAQQLLGEPTQQAIPEDSFDTTTLGGQLAGSLAGSIAAEGTGARVGGKAAQALTLAATRNPVLAQRMEPVGKVVGGLTASALGAGTGGLTGAALESTVRNLEDYSPETLNKTLNLALEKGGEEALWDLAGNSAFKAGSKALRAFKLKTSKGADTLQRQMQKKGTTLSLDQAVDNSIVKALGELLRGSTISSGPFQKLAEKQEGAVVSFFDDYVAEVADLTRRELDPQTLGRWILSDIKGTENIHSMMSSELFGKLDDLIDTVPAGTTTAKRVRFPAQAGVMPEVLEEVPVQLLKAPVDLQSVRATANDWVALQKRIGDVDPTGEGTSLLAKVAGGAENLTFKEAHTLMSDLKRLQRSGRLEGLPASVKIGSLIGDIEKAFNKAGDSLPEGASEIYKQARLFYKFGKKRTEADFINKLVDSDPTAVGEMLFKAAPEDVARLRNVLMLGDKLKGRELNSNWKRVQGGYLSNLLPQNVDQFGNAAILQRNKDRRLMRSMRTVFSKTELENIDKSVGLLEDIIKNQAKRGNLVSREIATLGAVAGAGTYAATAESSSVPAVLTFIAAPNILARAMTNPKFVNALTVVKNAPETSPVWQKASQRLVHLFAELEEEQSQ